MHQLHKSRDSNDKTRRSAEKRDGFFHDLQFVTRVLGVINKDRT